MLPFRGGGPRLGGGASWYPSRPRSARSTPGAPSRTARAPGRPPRGPTGARSHLSPALERLRQGDLVRVLEVAAHGQTAREPRHADAERFHQRRDVHRGRVSLEVRVGRQDALGHVIALDALEQLLHAEVLRTDAVERADRASEDVISALVQRALLD